MREIVIKLSDEEYEALQRASYYSFDKYTAYIAMKSGIVLPKGHGDLIDRSKLKQDIYDDDSWQYSGDSPYEGYKLKQIKNAPIVIEADEEMDSDEY